MLKSPPSWKWTGGSFQKHSHSEWILRRDRGEKFPKFNQSYGKAFESSRPSSPHNHSFVCGHLNNWNGICSFQEGVLSPCIFHRRPDQAGKTVWTKSSGEIFQCAKKFFNNLFLWANQNFVRQRPYTDILKLTLFRREPFSLFFFFTSLSLVKIEPLASNTLK